MSETYRYYGKPHPLPYEGILMKKDGVCVIDILNIICTMAFKGLVKNLEDSYVQEFLHTLVKPIRHFSQRHILEVDHFRVMVAIALPIKISNS